MTQERKAALAGPPLLDRPLSPRSLIGSLLLGMRPPRMPAGRLVEWCTLFGVAEGTARVALSRMVERDELVTNDGVYELAGHLRRRQPAQDWSLAPELGPWDGQWLVGIVSPGPRPSSDRVAFRDAARRLRLAEVREGVWTRPDNLPRAAAPPGAWPTVDAQCAWWTGRPAGDDVGLATALFATDAWAARARALSGRLEAATLAVRAGERDAIADAFLVGAATLTHVRADPLLPEELCGADWPGAALRAGYAAFQPAFADAVRTWFRGR